MPDNVDHSTGVGDWNTRLTLAVVVFLFICIFVRKKVYEINDNKRQIATIQGLQVIGTALTGALIINSWSIRIGILIGAWLSLCLLCSQ